MVMIRNVNEIISSLIDFYRLTQPDLDIKPGTVARDLFIDAPASQLSLLYEELSTVSNKQSLRLVSGGDLDNLAKNFKIVRNKPTASTGVALLTFSSINATININPGTIVRSSTGLTFTVTSGVVINPSSINFYKSVATKFRDQLDIAGISDLYAVEATVTCTTTGIAGNIGKFSLNRINVSGVSNVTNVNSFIGGTDQEGDAAFRNRVLSSFSGSSVGTALGYQNAALVVSGTVDAQVIEPGSPLMTRDGTVVQTFPDGTKTIITEGSGGKVDIVVLGSILQQNRDSYIYQDKSNNNDPTSSKNNFVLGQILSDANKTINRKRIDNIANKTLPIQPAESLAQVTGSISGANFKEKTIDSYGRVSGNYELIKDTGVYSGSPWGFDTFHWISNKISLFEDDRIKGQFNGQDPTTFSGVLEIPKVQQTIVISNEDSEVTSDRSIIQLLHTPANNVTRVFNVNTGERYLIKNQNLDNTGVYNTTGRIQISGNTLPSPTDVLQVDYNWIVEYDQYSDYDGLLKTSNRRSVDDSIDWGYASLVRNEKIKFTKDAGNNFFVGSSSHPISTVLFANKFTEIDATVTRITSGVYVERYSLLLNNLSEKTTSIESVKIKNTNIEQYLTSQNDGVFTSVAVLVGINTVYTTEIILPSDVIVSEGDKLTVILNSKDIFHVNNVSGTSSSNQITIPSSQVNTTATNINLNVSYVANVLELYSSPITSLPASRSGIGFDLLNNNGFANYSITNNSRRENQNVQLNFSSQFYVELNLPSLNFTLSPKQVLSVVRLSDGLELWNSDNLGQVQIGTSGKYQLILSGYNTPTTFDKVLVFYYASDKKRFQPFSYSNDVIKHKVENISYNNTTKNFEILIDNFISETGLNFSVLEANTDIELFSVSDGYLVNNGHSAIIGSLTQDFSSLLDISTKKILISGANPKNNGLYDIESYNVLTNTINISSSLKELNKNNITVVRVVDGKEIWDDSCSFNYANNKLILPKTTNVLDLDKVLVVFYNYSNLKQSLTKLVCTISDQINNPGVMVVSGTTINKATDIVFTATEDGLTQNINEALRKAINLNSTSYIPSNISLVKIAKLEKVETVSDGSDEVFSVLSTYDVKNSFIKNNLLYENEFLQDSSLTNLHFTLPSTANNTLVGEVDNTISVGDKLRITFYYSKDDIETLSYTRNGTLYTNKKFALINRVYVNSGFRDSQSTKIAISSFTQPAVSSRYKAFYDYLAPKQNERIIVTYNYNKLISDVTFAIENSRPINADVLVRSAKKVGLDLDISVVIGSSFLTSTNLIIQNLRDKLSTTLTTNLLNGLIDQVSIINAAQGVKGISRARINYFNKTGEIGQVSSIKAQQDEYFAPNNITINIETI